MHSARVRLYAAARVAIPTSMMLTSCRAPGPPDAPDGLAALVAYPDQAMRRSRPRIESYYVIVPVRDDLIEDRVIEEAVKRLESLVPSCW